MTAPLTCADVEKVAVLARLKLSDAELETFTQQLGRVLEYVNVLNEVDTTETEPMAHAVDLNNVFRDDESRDSLPREHSLANAPKADGRYFLVPPVLET